MRALNPFEGEFYRETLQVSRMTREMFCLMEGRACASFHVYPGGVGTVPSIQIFTDYMVRLMRYVEFMKKVVPLHDDLFDFFYEALPGYEEVGRRRGIAGMLGIVPVTRMCADYNYKTMDAWGKKMFGHARHRGGWQTGHHEPPPISISASASSSAPPTTRIGITRKPFVTNDPLGNPVDKKHPWNQTTIPETAKA